jgi:hypothetical protein
MSTEVAKAAVNVVIDEAVAQAREVAWKKLGRGIYETELRLQAMAQRAINSIKIPKDITEVKAAEANLAQVKREQATIQEERLEITRRFDAKAAELKSIGDSMSGHILQLSNSIIKIKREDEERLRAEQARIIEVKNLRESILRNLADVTAGFERMIVEKVDTAYTFALNKSIAPGPELRKYLDSIAQRVTAMDFAVTYAPSFRIVYMKDEEYTALLKELWVIEVAQYVEKFRLRLTEKFALYEVAITDKKKALEFAAKEQADALSKIESDKINQQTAATLDSTAIVLETPDVRPLKRAYKINMPETEESAIKIQAAYIANYNLCRTKNRITKWFNFSVGNMITALEKVKNEDNNFNATGIIFAEEEKL